MKSSRQIDRCPLLPGVWGPLKSLRSSGINGAKSHILGLSWHLISLLKLHFFVLFFSYFQQLFKITDPFLLLLIILWQWFRHLLFDDWRKRNHLKSEVKFYSATLFSKIFCIKRLLHTKEIASLFVLWIFFKLSF